MEMKMTDEVENRMLERVAMAMCEAEGMNADNWPYKLKAARAAVKAMMELDPGALKACVTTPEVDAVDWVAALFGTGVGSAQEIIVAGYQSVLRSTLSP